jgi:hypothetical protein
MRLAVPQRVDEERSWQHYEYVEPLVRMVKAKALLMLKTA